LKSFSEELRVESHYLLTQARKFRVTTRLMNDIEKMYVKEQINQIGDKRVIGLSPQSVISGGFVDVGAEIRERQIRS
jgi:hypothetical protein